MKFEILRRLVFSEMFQKCFNKSAGFVMEFCCLLPTSCQIWKLAQKHDKFNCVVLQVRNHACVCCFRSKNIAWEVLQFLKKTFKKLSRVCICLEGPLGLQP